MADVGKYELAASEVGSVTASPLSALCGVLGSSLTFDVLRSTISSGGGVKLFEQHQQIEGVMPVVNADGEQVLRLCFQSENRGKQLHATLVAPDGSDIATIDMSEGPKSLRSSVGNGIKALATGNNLGDEDAPFPPILVSAGGQEFGSFVGGTRQSGSGAADSGKWSRKDGTGGAVLLEPELDPVCSCFGGGCAVYRSPPEVSREESVLGKKEIPMVVAFVAAPSGAKPVADKVDPSQLPPGDVATIHLVTDEREGKMPRHFARATITKQVVCERLDGKLSADRTLDAFFLSAVLAALSATAKIPPRDHHGGGGGH